jgi:hypothetical protein
MTTSWILGLTRTCVKLSRETGLPMLTFDDHYEEGTYEEFLQRVYASYEHPANKKRLGQVFFNKLHKERPDVSSQIQGTLFDPFYHEYIHQKVYDQVGRLWYGEETE